MVNSSYFGKGVRVALRRCAVPLVLAMTCASSWATHVGLSIDFRTQVPEVTFTGGGGTIYNYGVTSGAGHTTVSGQLGVNDTVQVGKRAVVLLGFDNDYLLLDAAPSQDVVIDPLQQPQPRQDFVLQAYLNLPAQGLDPNLLLAGYDIVYLPKTLGNTCQADPTDCAGSNAAVFDVTSEIGNWPDTLRIVAVADVLPVPEPTGASLTALALAALAVTRTRRSARKTA